MIAPHRPRRGTAAVDVPPVPGSGGATSWRLVLLTLAGFAGGSLAGWTWGLLQHPGAQARQGRS